MDRDHDLSFLVAAFIGLLLVLGLYDCSNVANAEPDRLANALFVLHSKLLDENRAKEHIDAAREAGQAHEIEPELLLGQAYVESRYQSRSLSRVVCTKTPAITVLQPTPTMVCRRQTGIWASRRPGRDWRGSLYCGVLQVGGWIEWDECLQLMDDLKLNYSEGALHLKRWKNSPRCRWRKEPARTTCALWGVGGGHLLLDKCLEDRRASRACSYPWRVRSNAEKLRSMVAISTAFE